MGGAPAARSCPIEGGRSLFLGELPLRGAVGRSLFLGELPLRGAAQLKEGEGSLGGAPAARSCPIEGGRSLFLGELPLRGAVGRSLFLGELPLRGAAQLKEGEGSLGGAPAARSCPIKGGRSLFMGELPLRGAAR